MIWKPNRETRRRDHSSQRDEDEIREVLHASEVRANGLTAMALILSVAIIALVWVLNEINIFMTPHSIMNRLFIISLIALAIPCVLYLIVKGDRPWLKYVMLLFLTFVCALTNAVLSFNAILVMAIPVVVSTRYYSKRLTQGMAVLTIVIFLLATVWNVRHYGSVSMDFNYYPKPPAGTIITFTEALDFKDNILAGGVDAGRWMYNSLVLGYIPRVLVYLICAMVCVRVASEGNHLVYEQALVSKASASARKELDLATEIQEGMLPGIFPTYPDRGEFDMLIYDRQEHTCDVFEIKHSQQAVPEQGKHLRDEEKCELTERRFGPIAGKYVLYLGPEQDAPDGIAYRNAESFLKMLPQYQLTPASTEDETQGFQQTM